MPVAARLQGRSASSRSDWSPTRIPDDCPSAPNHGPHTRKNGCTEYLQHINGGLDYYSEKKENIIENRIVDSKREKFIANGERENVYQDQRMRPRSLPGLDMFLIQSTLLET